MDLSYENYTPPTEDGIDTTRNAKLQEFAKKVVDLAADYGNPDFIFATRNGVYAARVNDSLPLKELEAKLIEINGRPENIKLNN